jgi:hypothetical protein
VIVDGYRPERRGAGLALATGDLGAAEKAVARPAFAATVPCWSPLPPPTAYCSPFEG